MPEFSSLRILASTVVSFLLLIIFRRRGPARAARRILSFYLAAPLLLLLPEFFASPTISRALTRPVSASEILALQLLLLILIASKNFLSSTLNRSRGQHAIRRQRHQRNLLVRATLGCRILAGFIIFQLFKFQIPREISTISLRGRRIFATLFHALRAFFLTTARPLKIWLKKNLQKTTPQTPPQNDPPNFWNPPQNSWAPTPKKSRRKFFKK